MKYFTTAGIMTSSCLNSSANMSFKHLHYEQCIFLEHRRLGRMMVLNRFMPEPIMMAPKSMNILHCIPFQIKVGNVLLNFPLCLSGLWFCRSFGLQKFPISTVNIWSFTYAFRFLRLTACRKTLNQSRNHSRYKMTPYYQLSQYSFIIQSCSVSAASGEWVCIWHRQATLYTTFPKFCAF